MQQSMMKDVLAVGFEFSQSELNLAQQKQLEQRNNSLSGNGLSQSRLLLPLPDFDFRFSSRNDQPPKDNDALKERRFDLSLSLQTQQQQDRGKTSVQQEQSFTLTGSYTEQPDADGSDFRRTRFDIASSNIIYTESEQGELLSAMLEKQQSQREIVEDFNFDTIVNTDTEENQSASVENLMQDYLSGNNLINKTVSGLLSSV